MLNTDLDDFEVQGKVSLDLKVYEGIKRRVASLTQRDENMQKRVKEVLQASKELASFLTHLSKNVPNFDQLLGAFNESAEECEILKTDEGRYIIKLITMNDET